MEMLFVHRHRRCHLFPCIAGVPISGVPITHTVQHAGEIVITFPRAYHSGFSHGFNIGEAVNFATCDWLKWGRVSLTNYFNRKAKRLPLFSQDLMIYKLAKSLIIDNSNDTFKCPVQTASDITNLLHDLENISKEEEYHWARLTRGPEAVKALIAAHTTAAASDSTDAEDGDDGEGQANGGAKRGAGGGRAAVTKSPSGGKRRRLMEEVFCGVPKYTDMLDLHTMCENCKCLPFFSEIRCRDHPKKRACPGCAHSFCTECDIGSKYLRILMRPSEIRHLQSDVQRVFNCRYGAQHEKK